jgi:hypothetical protein
MRTDTRQKTVVKSSSSVVRVWVKKKRMGEGLKKFAPARVAILCAFPFVNLAWHPLPACNLFWWPATRVSHRLSSLLLTLSYEMRVNSNDTSMHSPLAGVSLLMRRTVHAKPAAAYFAQRSGWVESGIQCLTRMTLRCIRQRVYRPTRCVIHTRARTLLGEEG